MIMIAFGALVGAIFFGLNKPVSKMEYTPRDNQARYSNSVKDAADWLYRRRVNLKTNAIELNDIIKARNEAQAIFMEKGTNQVNVTWDEL